MKLNVFLVALFLASYAPDNVDNDVLSRSIFCLEGYEGVPMDYSEVDWKDFFSSSSVFVYLKTY